MLISLLMVTAGVAVTNKTQLPMVSSYAKCVTTKLGTVAAAPADREIALHDAAVACRAMSEASYTEGKLTMNGKPFPKSWWKEVVTLLDAADVELAKVILDAPADAKTFDVKWELPNGKMVAIGDEFMPGTIHVRVVAI